MAVHSDQLALARLVSTGSSLVSTLFTVGAGRTVIVKEVSLSQTAGSTPTSAYLYVVSGGVSHQRAVWDFSVNDRPDPRSFWLVLLAGQSLSLAQSSSRTLDCVVSGADLVGVPT